MKWLRFFGIAGIIVILDQILKFLVRTYKPDGKFITFTWNSGAAFGIFQEYALILGIIGIIVAGVLIYGMRSVQESDVLRQVFFGVFLGGIIGNAIDRIVFGAVVDFVNLRIWPVFNLADSCAVLGVIGILWLEFRKK